MTDAKTPSQLKVFLAHTADDLPNSYGDVGLEAMAQHADIVFNTTGRVLHGAELAAAAAGCQVIVAHRATPGNAETFAAAPDLVAFLRAAVDISTIDVPAATEQGVLVTRVTPGFSEAVAELGLGMMIDLARGISRARDAYRAGQTPAPGRGIQLSTAILGLVGYGRIAQRLGTMARGVGMSVQAYDPHVEAMDPGVSRATMDEVLKGSDFVFCLAAATPETTNLFDARAFALMKRGACFINLSRGELVDEAALEASLDSGQLRGAGLDVGRGSEQMPTGRLAARPDVVATPHIGGLTVQARLHQAMETVQQVAALASGHIPDGAVNLDGAHRFARVAARR